MTQREYVETLRTAAEEWITVLEGPEGDLDVYDNWNFVKRNLSPKTALALCDAWLTMQGKPE
jgi:hypothetical protein